MPQFAGVVSQQTLQVGVNGPNDATALHIVTGIAQCNLSVCAGPGQFAQQQATFAAKVGPNLTPAQFRRATASASIASIVLNGQGGNFAQWSVTSVEADYDDDSSQVQLEFDLSVIVGVGQPPATGESAAIVG